MKLTVQEGTIKTDVRTLICVLSKIEILMETFVQFTVHKFVKMTRYSVLVQEVRLTDVTDQINVKTKESINGEKHQVLHVQVGVPVYVLTMKYCVTAVLILVTVALLKKSVVKQSKMLMECFALEKNLPSLTKGKILETREQDEEDFYQLPITVPSTAEKILVKFNVQFTKMNLGASQKHFVFSVKRQLMVMIGVHIHLYVQKNVHLVKSSVRTLVRTRKVAKMKIYAYPSMLNVQPLKSYLDHAISLKSNLIQQ